MQLHEEVTADEVAAMAEKMKIQSGVHITNPKRIQSVLFLLLSIVLHVFGDCSICGRMYILQAKYWLVAAAASCLLTSSYVIFCKLGLKPGVTVYIFIWLYTCFFSMQDQHC